MLLKSFSSTAAKLHQSCPTLCNPIGGSPLGSPIPGIFQARTLEWVAISHLWDNIKCTNIWIIGVLEEEKRKGYEKNFEEIIVENFPNMEKEMVDQVQEVQRVPYRIKPKEKHAKTHTNQTKKD